MKTVQKINNLLGCNLGYIKLKQIFGLQLRVNYKKGCLYWIYIHVLQKAKVIFVLFLS